MPTIAKTGVHLPRMIKLRPRRYSSATTPESDINSLNSCEFPDLILTDRSPSQVTCIYLLEYPRQYKTSETDTLHNSTSWFDRFILFIISINTIWLIVETFPSIYKSDWYSTTYTALNWTFQSIYVIEALFKIYGYSLKTYFKSGWNKFDFFIVVVGFFPDTGSIQVLRALRALRVFKSVKQFPELKKLITSMIITLPEISYILFLLCIIFLVSAIVGNSLFRHCGAKETGLDFNWGEKYFGNILLSLWSLFQTMTGDSWSEAIARPGLKCDPFTFIFWIAFITASTFIVLNLFVGVVLEGIQKTNEENARVLLAQRPKNEQIDILIAEFAQKLTAYIERNNIENVEDVLTSLPSVADDYYENPSDISMINVSTSTSNVEPIIVDNDTSLDVNPPHPNVYATQSEPLPSNPTKPETSDNSNTLNPVNPVNPVDSADPPLILQSTPPKPNNGIEVSFPEQVDQVVAEPASSSILISSETDIALSQEDQGTVSSSSKNSDQPH